MGRHDQLGQMFHHRTGLDTLALWSLLVLRAHIERAYQRTTCSCKIVVPGSCDALKAEILTDLSDLDGEA